jgi:hypothetical protein
VKGEDLIAVELEMLRPFMGCMADPSHHADLPAFVGCMEIL